jgi:hypothetical protein
MAEKGKAKMLTPIEARKRALELAVESRSDHATDSDIVGRARLFSEFLIDNNPPVNKKTEANFKAILAEILAQLQRPAL